MELITNDQFQIIWVVWMLFVITNCLMSMHQQAKRERIVFRDQPMPVGGWLPLLGCVMMGMTISMVGMELAFNMGR